MKTPLAALAQSFVALALVGCMNVNETARERLERWIVFSPERKWRGEEAPPAPRGVEWVYFSVHDPQAHPERLWAPWTPDDQALASTFKSMGGSMFESLFEANEGDHIYGVDADQDVAYLEREYAKKQSKAQAEARQAAYDGSEHDRILSDMQADPFYWRLHGAYVEAPEPAARRAVVLFCHGSRGQVEESLPRLLKMAKHFNVSIMAFDYRGYGRSEGQPDESGVCDDARAARLWLANRTGVSEQAVVLMGSAFGSAVAVDLAANDGCRALVLENAFTSLREVADEQAPNWLKPSRFMKSEFDCETKIARYHGPLLQCHGDANSVVPIAQGQRVFAAAAGPKNWVTIKGGKHEGAPNREYRAALEAFFAELPPEPPRLAPAQPGVQSESIFGGYIAPVRRQPQAVQSAPSIDRVQIQILNQDYFKLRRS